MKTQETYYNLKELQMAKKKVKAMPITVSKKAGYKTLAWHFKDLLDELCSINKYIFYYEYHSEFRHFLRMVEEDYKTTTKEQMGIYAKHLKKVIYRTLTQMEEYAK